MRSDEIRRAAISLSRAKEKGMGSEATHPLSRSEFHAVRGFSAPPPPASGQPQCAHGGQSEPVPLHDPVKFEPPPPRPPPVTHFLSVMFSGVPAWSPPPPMHAFPCDGKMFAEL